MSLSQQVASNFPSDSLKHMINSEHLEDVAVLLEQRILDIVRLFPILDLTVQNRQSLTVSFKVRGFVTQKTNLS